MSFSQNVFWCNAMFLSGYFSQHFLLIIVQEWMWQWLIIWMAFLKYNDLLWLTHYTPRTMKLLGGILVSLRPSICPFVGTSVRPSRVRPTSGVRSVASTVLVGSISYLYILSSNFRRCVGCKVSCKISKFEVLAIFKICNFDFVLFWLGIWCESLVWVIMGQRGVSQNTGVLVVLVVAWWCHIAT